MKSDTFDLENWHNQTRQFLNLIEANPELLEVASQFPAARDLVQSKRLETNIAGIKLKNPLLVGAGWDKAGVAVRGLCAAGFAGVEVGSVQNYPQEGNAQPRHFELAPGVTINRYGFNSPGAQAVAENLKAYEGEKLVIGINIGKNKEIPDIATLHMIAAVAERLYKYASYFVINVSSPNTPGLRKLQSKKPLSKIIKAVREIVDSRGGKPPIFVKVSPDLDIKSIDEIINVVIHNKANGIVAANTTTSRKIKAKYGKKWQHEAGGLSGDDEDYRQKTNKLISHIYKQTKGKLTVIGVGGVQDTLTTIEKLQAGASAVQTVTALRYKGLGMADEINRGLLAWMDENNVKNIPEIIGSKH